MVTTNRASATISRRRRERQARQRAILMAARDLFLTKGIAATTMDDIAGACELAKGTLYLYFAGKDEIAFSLLIQTTDELLAALRDSLEPHAPAIQQLEGIALAYYRFFLAQPESFRYMFIVPHESYSGHVADELIQRWAAAGRAALDILAELLRKGHDEGELVVPDTWLAAVALWSAVTGVIVIPSQEVRRPFIGRADTEQLVLLTVRSFLNGMRPITTT